MVSMNGSGFCWRHTALLPFMLAFKKPSIILPYIPFVLTLAHILFLKIYAIYFGYYELVVLVC